MNISFLISLRSLKKNKSRTFSTAIGIFLSVILMTAIAVLVTSLLSSLIVTTKASKGDWHIFIWNVDNEIVTEAINTGKIEKFATIETKGYSEITNKTNDKKPYIELSSVSSNINEMLSMQILEGRFPKNPSEVIIPKHLQDDYTEMTIGSKIFLSLGTRLSKEGKLLNQNSSYLGQDNEEIKNVSDVKEFIVVGICSQVEFIENDFSPGYTILNYADEIPNNEGTVYFQLKNPKKDLQEIADFFPESKLAYNKDLLGAIGATEGENIADMSKILAGILIFIVAFAAYILIKNSFMISALERKKQSALLTSIGATKRQIAMTVFFEAIILAIILIPLGIIFGILLIMISLNSIGVLIAKASYLNLIFTIDINFLSLFLIAILSFVILITSCIKPALITSGKTAISGIRQNNEIKNNRKRKQKDNLVRKNKISIETELVFKNFKRFNRKYRQIIFSLVFSISIFIITGVYTVYSKEILNHNFALLDYDIYCNSYKLDINNSINTMYNPLTNINGVDESGWVSTIEAGYIELDKEFLSPTIIEHYNKRGSYLESVTYLVIEDERFDKLLLNTNMNTSNNYFDSDRLRAVAFAKVTTYKKIGEDFTFESNFIYQAQSVDATINYMTNENRREYYNQSNANYLDYSRPIPITIDVVQNDKLIMELSNYLLTDGFFVVIPKSMLLSYADEVPSNIQMFFKAKNHKNVYSEMEKIIEGNKWDIFIDDITNSFEIEKNSIGIFDVFSKIFVGLITIIMILNIMNTIISNIHIRNKEFAVIRSIGISKRGLIKMLFYESGLFGIISIVLGAFISSIASILLYFSFKTTSLSFYFPIRNLLIAIVGVILIVIFSTFIASRKVIKTNIIDSIKNDLT